MPPMRLMRDDRVVPETVALVSRQLAHARDAQRRSARAARRQRDRRAPRARTGRTLRCRDRRRRHCESDRRRRSAGCAPRCARSPTASPTLSDVMEDAAGAPTIVLRLRLEKRGDRMLLDYTGTSPQLRDAAQRRLRRDALGRVLRDSRVAGARHPDERRRVPADRGHVPEGTLLNPNRPAAVSAGNVETSMRNADLVLAAFGVLAPERVPAQSGGSMNNVMMGGIDERGAPWAFYETNGCGMGARPGCRRRRRDPGAHDQHAQHADRGARANVSAARDALRVCRRERRARALSWRARARSRAAGSRAATSTISLLAERHAVRPHGSAGGGDGATGRHTLRCGWQRYAAAGETTPAERRRNARRADRRRRRVRQR